MTVRGFGSIGAIALLAVLPVACSSLGDAKDATADTVADVADVPAVDAGTDLPSDDAVRDPGGPADIVPDLVPDPAGDGSVGEIPADVPPDTGTDVPCVPDCTGRVCGWNGCDDQCGYCEQGFLCTVDGTCEQFCRPVCTREDGSAKSCGPDGCNGDCPPGCADNEECSPTFTCVLKSCVPKCDGRVCGGNGCGGDCGSCGDGMFCTTAGQCTVDTNCYDVTPAGRCVGNERQWCEGGVLKKEVCDTGAGLVCGEQLGTWVCRLPEVCQPRCTNRECGPDGCSGTCGECAADQACSTGGRCGEPCPVDMPAEGLCLDDFTLAFCHQGILLKYDCYAANPPVTCRWDPEQSQYNCY